MRAPIGAYVASKYVCVGYSEMLRAELAGDGIGVSALCPGVVSSNLMETIIVVDWCTKVGGNSTLDDREGYFCLRRRGRLA